MIIVDTSVLIAFLRGHRTAAAGRLREIEEQEVPFSIPAICVQEVLQGARDEREWRLLRSVLVTQLVVVPGDFVAVHLEAARIYFDCRRRGISPRSSIDCLIAAQVLETKGTLLHDDDEFDRIARVRQLRCLRS